jgi:hypothetical protein
VGNPTSPARTEKVAAWHRSSAVEQGNHNPLVGGSNPSGATIPIKGLGLRSKTAKMKSLAIVSENSVKNQQCVKATASARNAIAVNLPVMSVMFLNQIKPAAFKEASPASS